MSSPPEQIFVMCPKCGTPFDTYIRRSMNLGLDDFDDEYLEEMSTATCPFCHHKINLDVLIVSEDGTFKMGSEEEDEEHLD